MLALLGRDNSRAHCDARLSHSLNGTHGMRWLALASNSHSSPNVVHFVYGNEGSADFITEHECASRSSIDRPLTEESAASQEVVIITTI